LSLTWPKPSIPFGSVASLISHPTWSKPPQKIISLASDVRSVCGFCCGCGWYVIPNTQYTLTRKHLSHLDNKYAAEVEDVITNHNHSRNHTSFQMAMSSHCGMWAGVAQGGLISPVLFSLYVNDVPTPSDHIELTKQTKGL